MTLIFSNRTVFVSPESKHRTISSLLRQINLAISAGQDLPDKQLMDCERHLLDYPILVEMHLLELASAFRQQFSSSVYRRTSDAEIVVLPDFKAIARAREDELQDTIEVSLGLVLAMEDIWQCVISDNNTDLHAFCGLDFQSPNGVFRNVDLFNAFDQFRFVDYSMISRIYSFLADTEQTPFEPDVISNALALHNCLCFKMISHDDRRVRLANCLTDLSINWILAHEDAHVYFGHARYFRSELGIGGDELEHPDEVSALLALSRKLSLQQVEGEPSLRLIAELEADELASTRMVDYLFDDEIFKLLPQLLSGHSYFLSNFDRPITEPVARFLTIVRVAIAAAVGSIFVFHRAIEKARIQTSHYPNIAVRIANIIVSVIYRANRRLSIRDAQAYQTFELPSIEWFHYLATGISLDIKVLKWNLLSHPLLLVDPDLPRNHKLLFSEYDDPIDSQSSVLKFVAMAVEYSAQLVSTGDMMKLGMLVAHSDVLRQLVEYQAVEHERSNRFFREPQEQKRPHMKEKLAETYQGIENRSRDLKRILEIANLAKDFLQAKSNN